MGKFKKVIASFLVACMTMVTPLSAGMAKVSASKQNSRCKKSKNECILNRCR